MLPPHCIPPEIWQIKTQLMRSRDTIMALLVTLLCTSSAYNQDIYLGAGNDSSIIVTTSDEHQLYTGTFTATGNRTVDGSGMNAKRMAASRFLAQATIGYDDEMVDEVLDLGFEGWIDSQFVKEPGYLLDSLWAIHQQSWDIWIANGNDSASYPSIPNHVHADYTWWQISPRSEDQLRQRVAEALSQIIVVSLNSVFSGRSQGMMAYYDLLLEHAFGNYEDLIYDISTNPAMGIYLTFANNPASDTIAMTFPDENYARELMQLFMIGLDELNNDGTPVEDSLGNRIPTYNNDDIAEFAKIFTGLSFGERLDQNPPYFGMSLYSSDLTVPMIMYDSEHEQGEKHLLNGYVIPDGQTGIEDLEDAIEHLFNHDNVGPFLAIRLIQRLVKSNPTPAYVGAVADAFNDNGQGVRGDMKAVIKAILMHPEARECSWVMDDEQGQLREPILRKTQFYRMFGVISPMEGKYWNYSYWYENDTDMHPMRSPSVFNFYPPTFAPNGDISEAGLVAPEFAIYNSRTSIGYANQVYRWIDNNRVLQTSWYESNQLMPADLAVLFEYSKDPDALIDYLDARLTHGQMTDETRAIIKSTVSAYGTSIDHLLIRIKLATYLTLVSADYTILK